MGLEADAVAPAGRPWGKGSLRDRLALTERPRGLCRPGAGVEGEGAAEAPLGAGWGALSQADDGGYTHVHGVPQALAPEWT